MRGGLEITLFLFTLFSFVAMMHIKTDVQALVEKRGKLMDERLNLEEDMRVLRAEFAHLSEPRRLQNLSFSMGLSTVEASQVHKISLPKGAL